MSDIDIFMKWLDAQATVTSLAGIDDDEIIPTWPETKSGLFNEYPQLTVGALRAFHASLQQQQSAHRPEPAQPTIQYSTDYDALWSFICAGQEALAFVDYRFMDEPKDYKPWRDAAKVARRGPYQINIGARGISYASAHEFDAPKWPDEKELFIKICKNSNLEWASPQQPAPRPVAP